MTRETERRLALSEKYRSDLSRVRKEVEAELTRVIPKNNEGVSYPLGKPEAAYYVVAEENAPWHTGGLPPYPLREDSFYEPVEYHRFRVTQHAYRLPNGNTVVWFGLEPCR